MVEATDFSQVLLSSTIRLISLMIMEPVSTSEMSLNYNQAIRRHILEDRSICVYSLMYPIKEEPILTLKLGIKLNCLKPP